MISLIPHEDFLVRALYSFAARTRFIGRFVPRYFSYRGWEKEDCNASFFNRLHGLFDLFNIPSDCFSYSEADRLHHDADNALNHRFEVLGSGCIVMKDIKWNTDFKTDFIWSKRFYTQQRKQSIPGADIKMPWELSRCHHLLWLGAAFIETKKEQYAIEVINQIENWIEENPFGYTVNWACSMEVAIRSVNWLCALEMISDSTSITVDFINRVSCSIFQHGYFIYNNLEKTSPYSNNHYFSNIVGLLYIGRFFNKTKKGKEWFQYGLKEFYKEIRVQVLPSGVDCERSISYHRLMTEMAIYTYYMLIRAKVDVPMDIVYRLQTMLYFVQAYIKPNGKAPMVEDNDDGRFLPFVKREYNDHGYLLDNNCLDYKFISHGLRPLKPFVANKVLNFTDAGHFIIKSNSAYLFVTNGDLTPYREGKQVCGTHTHNDRLSFEFAIGNNDIFIDPGAYIYTANLEKHHEFRSTSKHNTVFVDGEEQNLLLNIPFLVRRNTFKAELSIEAPNICYGKYETINGKMLHYRRFYLGEKELTIVDKVYKKGMNHTIQLFYHLSPDVFVEIIDNRVFLYVDKLKVEMKFESPQPLTISKIDDTVSPSYGVLVKSKTIRIESVFIEEFSMKTLCSWL